MEKIQWQNNLSVGVPLIDAQHKQWIAHYNDIVESIASRQNKTQIAKTLGFLIDYTGIHFATEEKHMAGSRYPAFQEHKSKHDGLRATLGNLVKEFEEEGATGQLSEAIDTFLGHWLIRHIQEVDTKFGEYVKEKGIVLV